MTVDRYGGTSVLGRFRPGEAFRLVERNGRFLFVTPEGHGFWLRACYGVDTIDGGTVFLNSLHAKYRQHPSYSKWRHWFGFVEGATRYLKWAGFNVFGEYTSNYAWPVEGYKRGATNPEQLPFIGWTSVAKNCKRPPYLVKDLQYGVDREVTPGLWRVEGFPDVFDPAFEQTYRSALSIAGIPQSTPWLLGISMDDRDYLFGFGASREFGGWHNHLGWLATATRPRQERNHNVEQRGQRGVTYTDTTVYTKLALRKWLQERYGGDLSGLNRSWGARYTTWDTDGQPWPQGTGLLDESGRSPWLGRDFYLMSDAHPQVRKDLDEFVGVIAERYFSVAATSIRAQRPGHLVFGPMPLSSAAHPEILKAAGRWCDAIQFSNDGEAGFRRGYRLTGKPFFVWTTFMAQADSPLADKPGWKAVDSPTQEARGRAYADLLDRLACFRTDDGAYPCVGIDWWAYSDKVVGGEARNFGLVTIRDNPYDGRAARVAQGRDAWGYPTGGEARDYGDFLSAARAANERVVSLVRNSTCQSFSSSPGVGRDQISGPLFLAGLAATSAERVSRRGVLRRLATFLMAVGGRRAWRF